MRWIVLLAVLWLCPVSFANEHTEDEAPAVAAVERGKCPGGICPRPSRPRPKR
jgi:hypothetical protein